MEAGKVSHFLLPPPSSPFIFQFIVQEANPSRLIHEAVLNGDAKEVSELIRAGEKVDVAGGRGF
jgi:hypothetical protein